MRTKDLKSSKAITLIALVVTIIVLLILAGISIAALTGDNGILTNAQQTSTQSAYKGAEEQVKIAYMAVKTEIMAQTTKNGTYNPASPENTQKLANIVRKDLGLAKGATNSNGTWKVDDTTEGVIKIEYKDSKIDKEVIGITNLTQLDGTTVQIAVPREEGYVHYQINLLETQQDAKLFLDVASDGGSGGGGSNFVGLSVSDGDASLPSGVTEVPYADVQNANLKDTSKIKTVIKGTGTNNSDEVPIPLGAKYVTGTEITGVVIEYKGSEFVWVPVPDAVYDANSPKASKLPSGGSWASEGSLTGLDYTPMSIKIGDDYKGLLYSYMSERGSSLRYEEDQNFLGSEEDYQYCVEPDVLSMYDIDNLDNLKNNINYDISQTFLATIGLTSSMFAEEMKTNYNLMVISVSKYGGFYVGRYETSYNGQTGKVQSISGVKSMSCYDNNQTWYGLYDKQKGFTEDGDKLQSSMIWGSQFDAMLNWFLRGPDSSRVTATPGVYVEVYDESEGAWIESEKDEINNIYDLWGNLEEFTLEANKDEYNDCRTLRGGNAGAWGNLDVRGCFAPYSTSRYVRFTSCTLYKIELCFW